MPGFARHGIDHLSASSLNLWAAEPALWVMERLLKRRSPDSAIAARGKAVEHGVDLGLRDPALAVEACARAAEQAFDRAMALSPDSRRDDERKNLAGYVATALAELRPYGVPTAYQDRVEIELDGVSVPLVGYIDWRFDQHGLIVDLKTSERLPAAISDAHGRQGAVVLSQRQQVGAVRDRVVLPACVRKHQLADAPAGMPRRRHAAHGAAHEGLADPDRRRVPRADFLPEISSQDPLPTCLVAVRSLK